MNAKQIIKSLEITQRLSKDEAKILLSSFEFTNTLEQKKLNSQQQLEVAEIKEYLRSKAQKMSQRIFGNKVYMRGLIEFSSFCKNDCYYCGLRASNKKAERYRLDIDQILSCYKMGYDLGFRSFVMQGGEDDYYTADRVCEIVTTIKQKYPDCALTLSVGEKTDSFYASIKKAGVDRFLLRHETANNEHYAKLHPQSMSLENRKHCIRTLKQLKFQTGIGIMIGSPYQTIDTLVEDLMFMQEIQPEMIGMGPFLIHADTPFAQKTNGPLELTLIMLSITRLLFPLSPLPSTTALGTLKSGGQTLGILAGANVVMPNLSPLNVRKKYLLYDNKIAIGTESAEGIELQKKNMATIGYELTGQRGDYGTKPL
ncbi:MAG: [FeFe] hydrogenase H-cluster radical SAM maturase HydE [Treponemataceae bacterium]